MLMDYHVHTCYSHDSRTPIKAQLDAARSAGITHLCFTDHVDFDGCSDFPADLAARNAEIDALRPLYPEIDIACGMEIGMKDETSARLSLEHAKGCRLDFIIGSLHLVDGVRVYKPPYFEGRSREEAYITYLERIHRYMAFTEFSVLGHYDFCTKHAPYPERPMTLSIAPELFDDIFRALIQQGRSLEVNTASWRDSPAWGLDVLRRYRQLGGEFVTVGSDAHVPEKLGRRIGDAVELIRAAGIPYLASYKELRPILHKV